MTRDREARCWSPGEGVNFIYSSRVRFRVRDHHRAPVSTSHAIYRSLSPSASSSLRGRSAREPPGTASIYLFIHLRRVIVTRVPRHRLYDICIQANRMIYLSPSNRFRCTHASPFRLLREIRFFFYVILECTYIYIYYMKITFPCVPFLTIRKFIVFESVRFSSL